MLIKLIVNKNYQDKEFLLALNKFGIEIEDYYTLHQKHMREIDNMARIKFAESKWGVTELSTLTDEELRMRLDSISDSDIKGFLSSAEARISSQNDNTTHSDDFNEFWVALGMSPIEASSLTSIVVNEYHLRDINELKSFDRQALHRALSQVFHFI